MKAYKHFTSEERESLLLLLQEGKSKTAIAAYLGKDRSSIYREIERNWHPKYGYLPLSATSKYKQRRKKCRPKLRFEVDSALIAYTGACLDKYWSPEIIAVTWKRAHPSDKLSHSTIYRALERKLLKGYSGFTHLRRRNKQKYVRKDSAVIKPDNTIHERPQAARHRARIGDWEGDTVRGARGKGQVITMADRKSRYFMAMLSPDSKAATTEKTVIAMMQTLPVESLTFDNGPEFAKHRDIAKSLNTTIYFTDPKSPWQRGTNENLNDVFRFFYPKGCDFTIVTQDELDATLELINTRPRKCLEWRTPNDVFFDNLLHLD